MADGKLLPLRPTLNDPAAVFKPKIRILIVSTWRTGSSFLSEIIESSPGVFYSYEPLHSIDEHSRMYSAESQTESVKLIENIFQCRLPAHYLAHINGLGETKYKFITRNSRLWNACHHNQQNESLLCTNADFISRLCSHFPVHLMKLVRLPVSLIGPLLQQLQPLKVVFLVRDPRAIMASRANLTWCSHPSCNRIEQVCRDIEQDISSFQSLQKSFPPDRLHMIRFEDFVADAENESLKLFTFIGLQMAPSVKMFLRTHTRSSDQKDPYSTKRDSKSIPFEWRHRLASSEVSRISKHCAKVLDLLNYSL